MRAIKLHFVDANHLDILLNDQRFMQEIQFLNPNRLDKLNISLSDPILQHWYLDTEVVVLSIFGRAIKRLIFPATNFDIEFKQALTNQLKGGLTHNGNDIIDSTDVQI